MRILGILGKTKHPDIEQAVSSVLRPAKAAGCRVLVEKGLANLAPDADALSPEEVAAQAECLVVLGGDGTLIRALRLLDERQVPIFGINLGYLGFLTPFTVDEAEAEFTRVLRGDFETDDRMRLQVDVLRGDKRLSRQRVFNDLVVSSAEISRITTVRAHIDGSFVTAYRADGLIVATPSGSTAYAMAAGGPIVMPNSRALVLAPICPHTLTMRPLVVHGDSRIRLELDEDGPPMVATFDGQHVVEMACGDRLEIEQAPGRVLLVRPPRDQFQLLRSKLKWGQG